MGWGRGSWPKVSRLRYSFPYRLGSELPLPFREDQEPYINGNSNFLLPLLVITVQKSSNTFVTDVPLPTLQP